MDFEGIKKAAGYVQERIGDFKPEVGIILGSGLGDLGESIEGAEYIAYKDIPGFPISTAIGHRGNLVCGMLGGKKVIAMQGRFHYYEGYPMDLVTLPIRVMSLLGIEYLLVSCAVGGINPGFKVGDLMLIRDHISTLPNPLIGKNLEEFGVRFQDMTCAYDLELQDKMLEISEKEGIPLQRGVLVTCSGPCYETPAEYNFFRTIGGDAVGMSTSPEVIVARHCGIRVLGMSVITDMAHNWIDDYVTDGDEIVRVAAEASVKMSKLFTRLLESI